MLDALDMAPVQATGFVAKPVPAGGRPGGSRPHTDREQSTA